ncbi:UDP-glycosyltransferase 89B1 [Acorus gramineus]|uniref:UDP-glycosyltransferase 89B1 n=1 Tax=Acorus gramineus TaxID=55184 RepID=A0AAV9BB42_ACOGR|nr:UDP-glycosyltransferase 89B1 [Acorus gramineus]
MSHTRSPHVLILPFPLMGHAIPLLDLAHQLTHRGLSVTVHVTPDTLPLISSSPSFQTLLLPIPAAEVANGDSFMATFIGTGSLHGPILQWAKAHESPPSLIVSDIFLGWTRRLAGQLGVPRVVFSPSGALTISLINSLFEHLPKRAGPVGFSGLPGSPTFPWYQLPLLISDYREGDPTSEFMRDGMLDNVASWGIIVNSFAGLEGEYLRHLEKNYGPGRVWAVGPLGLGGTSERGGTSSVPVDDVLRWLDGCPDGSVVYVCFGSLVALGSDQIEAIAAALELSGVRFLWAYKARNDGGPEGQVGERGFIIRGWAPQVAILGHRAVGSFLTHCGWNSTLEAITAGVPLLAWPMAADQYFTARLLEELGVAVRVCERTGTVPNSGDLARALAESVSEAWPERVRARELRELALGAVKKGGSSCTDLRLFVEEIQKLTYEKYSDRFLLEK